MPSLTAQAVFYPSPKRDNPLRILEPLFVIHNRELVYYSLCQQESCLLWAIKWSNLAKKIRSFYFFPAREKERIVAELPHCLIGIKVPFLYHPTYKIALHSLLVYSIHKYGLFRGLLNLQPAWAAGAILYSMTFIPSAHESYEKFFRPRIFLYLNSNYAPILSAAYKKFLFNIFYGEWRRYTETEWFICPFRYLGSVKWHETISIMPSFEFGFIYTRLLLLLALMNPVGYYLYFYDKLMQPYFSYKKIYTINWP